MRAMASGGGEPHKHSVEKTVEAGGAEDSQQQQAYQQGEDVRSHVAYAVDWMRNVGKSVPESVPIDQGFYDSLITHGVTLDLAEKGRVLCTMRVPPRLCNAGGKLHGGAVTSIVDIIGSAAIFSTGSTSSGVSVDINVTFMSGVKMGEDIEIESKALRVGKSLAVVCVDLRHKSTGQMVAQGRHTKFLAFPNTPLRSKL